jgi:aspartate kinase
MCVARYVVKFGGTSLSNIDRIQHAASIVEGIAAAGHQVVVVVSAMAGTTNQLVHYANTLCATYTPEHDVVVASGEQITAGLMALALQKNGLKSQSLLAHQIKIQTCDTHGNAEISHIATELFYDQFDKGFTSVVAGFQGITPDNRITTLGRGGSDTTAVALAAALKADACIIYTDVDGVFTSDPRVVPHAQKMDQISYAEMFELAKTGAKVLHPRCVELGMKNDVDLYVRSSFVSDEGTHISSAYNFNDTQTIRGIAHSLNEVHIQVQVEADLLNQLENSLIDEKIAFDRMTSNTLEKGTNRFDFTVSKNDLARTETVLSKLKSTLGLDILAIDMNIVKISIVGFAVKFDPTLESRIAQLLLLYHIDMHLMSRVDIKLSLILAHDHMTKAMGVLHDALIQKK